MVDEDDNGKLRLERVNTCFTPYIHGPNSTNALAMWTYFCVNYGDQRFFFQFNVIINRPILVNLFRFIRIFMLWVYGHYTYFTLWTSQSTVRVHMS